MQDANRIGKKCWFRQNAKNIWRGGTLHAWSTDFVEFDEGPGLFPVAVIEDDETMMCVSVYVKYVCFAAVPPGLQPILPKLP